MISSASSAPPAGSAAAIAPNACRAAALISRPGTSLASGSSTVNPAARPAAYSG